MKSMFYILYTCLLALLCSLSTAQNLVPNPSFEDYTICPDNWAAMANVMSWNSCGNSPDYFNACRTVPDFGVPLNVAGYQLPADGDGYCGVATYDGAGTAREIICVELDQPLLSGVATYLSFKVSPGGFGNYMMAGVPNYTTSGIGMLFSTQPLNWPMFGFLNYAHLYLDTILVDTVGWTIIQGSFVPDSAYTHLNIGNFFADSLSNVTLLDTDGTFDGAFCFVDDVCVSLDPNICSDKVAITEGEALNFLHATLLPDGLLKVHFSEAASTGTRLRLIDTIGRICKSVLVPAGSASHWIDVNDMTAGIYALQAKRSDEVRGASFLIHLTP